MTKREPDPVASDGLVARESGIYSELKLGWLDVFCAHALAATQRMPDRVYLDLFAGPGRSILRETGEETDAGALRALAAVAPGKSGTAFTDAHLLNLDPAHADALQARVSRMQNCWVPRENITFHRGDTNRTLPVIMKGIRKHGYVLAFVDPENASQLPWSTVRELRSQGHSHVDAYLLFPWGFDLRRKLGKQDVVALDTFFGTREWRNIVREFPSDTQGPQRSRAFRALYLKQLGTLWKHAIEVQEVNLKGRHHLYWMLYATDNDAARKIADGVVAAMAKKSDQGNLFT